MRRAHHRNAMKNGQHFGAVCHRKRKKYKRENSQMKRKKPSVHHSSNEKKKQTKTNVKRTYCIITEVRVTVKGRLAMTHQQWPNSFTSVTVAQKKQNKMECEMRRIRRWRRRRRRRRLSFRPHPWRLVLTWRARVGRRLCVASAGVHGVIVPPPPRGCLLSDRSD